MIVYRSNNFLTYLLKNLTQAILLIEVGLLFLRPMLSKKLIGLFCILVFSFQLVPIQQVGLILYSAQMTEERPHNPDDTGSKSLDDSLKQFCYSSSDHGNHQPNSGSMLTGMAVDVKVHTRSSDDIQTPPPNNFS